MKKKVSKSILNKKNYFRYIIITFIAIIMLFFAYKILFSSQENEQESLFFPRENPAPLSDTPSNATLVSNTTTNTTTKTSGGSSGGSSGSGTSTKDSVNTSTNTNNSNNTSTVLEDCGYLEGDNGNEAFTKSYCDDKKAVVKQDICQDENILIEYVLGTCEQGCKQILVNCASLGNYSCLNGACVLKNSSVIAEKPGAGLYQIKGSCTENDVVIGTDSCVSQYILREWFAINNSCTYHDYNCTDIYLKYDGTEKYCEDGRCAQKAVDSDDRDDEFAAGTCKDYIELAAEVVHSDICARETDVIEWYIDADSPAKCSSKTIECAHGCLNGACVDIGDSDCESACKSISRSTYNYGFCTSYLSGGALSQSATCSAKGAFYESLSGCDRNYICCCDSLEIA